MGRKTPSLKQRLVDWIAGILTKPLATYDQHVPNDPKRLKDTLRKGDLILIEGDQRVSMVIKYLTQSCWSHVAMYVGDEVLQQQPGLRKELEGRFGDEARHLVIEALPDGVIASPVLKYLNFNLRVCRPASLRQEDLDHVLRDVISRLGHAYDVRNLVDLARYLFPVSLIPRRFRRRALALGSGEPTTVICSSMLAEAFHTVGFPVMPRIVVGSAPPGPVRLVDRLLRRTPEQRLRYMKRSPTLITPRDFDLSPYFEIIKFNRPAESFDYRKITWAEDERQRVSTA